MLHIISRDGTKLAYEKTGAGPALLIIGGALADHHNYTSLAISLADQFEVFNYDRRGRGQSADTTPYAVDREVEDVLTIIESIGRPVIVYGHSSGSALAIHVAAVGDKITKLILADPPFTPHSNDDIKAIEEFKEEMAVIQALYDKGDYKGSAAFFLSGFGLSDEEVEGILSSPEGEGMIDCARTLPYDYKILDNGLVPTERAAKITVPTLILAAKDMPETAQALAGIIPNASFQPMEASTHELNPAYIADAIVGFAR